MLRKKLAIFALISFFGGTIATFGAFLNPVHAASVISYIDLTAQPATAPSTISTQPELATSTADEFYISFVASSNFANTNTVAIHVPNTFTSLALCGTSTTDADGAGGADGSLSLSGQTFTYTFSSSTTAANSTGVEFCFAATTPSTAGNYSIAVSTSTNDESAALIYVGDANEVTVTATVPTSMSLRIKNPSTTADTTVCSLGIMNPASVNTCTYRIAAGTNLATGMTVQVVADNQLNTAGDVADINDINTATNTTIDAGVEEHGAYVSALGAFTAGTGYGAYNDIPTTADAEPQETVLTSTGPVDDSNIANWATITHGASISTGTAGGVYDAIITYRAYANI
jgi:hypothetical protein